jgi:hypothetical protein
MYSFGMVCLWALFRDRLLEFLKNCIPYKGNDSDESTFFLSNEAPQSRLESLQASDQLTSVVETIVKTSSFLKDSQRNNLATFFHALLCKDSITRWSDWRKLVQLLTDQAVNGTWTCLATTTPSYASLTCFSSPDTCSTSGDRNQSSSTRRLSRE